jgi:SAM-dependent methyltransferase
MRPYVPAVAALTLLACNAPPAAPDAEAQTPLAPSAQGAANRTPDVIYVPTPQETVDAMLKLAEVKAGDVVYDLGSGDGRIPITAAKTYGVKSVGIDIDPERIAEANQNAKAAGVTNKVTFRQADLFASDISEASVVTLYLLSSLNDKLRPKLMKELKPGTRVVSHAFPMTGWEPEKTVQTGGGVIYLWRIPKP